MDGGSAEDDTNDEQYSVEITPETLYTVIGVCAGGLLAIVLLILGAIYCRRRKWREVSDYYRHIYYNTTNKPAHTVTSIKESPVIKGHLFSCPVVEHLLRGVLLGNILFVPTVT